MKWILLSIVLPLLMSLVGRQLWEFLPWLSRIILVCAAKLLPREERERYSEEWGADLANVPGALAQVAWSLGCMAVAGRRAVAFGLRSARPPALPPPIVFAPAAALSWPWTPQPAKAEVRVQGDTDAAIRLGVGRDTAQLAWISQLLAAGAGPDTYVTVTWTSDGTNACCVAAVGESFMHHQRFVRTDDGHLAVDLGVFMTSRPNFGLAKVALRNALSVFDEAGVKYAVACASGSIGSQIWATLGAEPLDAAVTRQRLCDAISRAVDEGRLSAEDAVDCGMLIVQTPNSELMHRLSRFVADDRAVGRELLTGFAWDAFADLSDDEQRRRLIFALG